MRRSGSVAACLVATGVVLSGGIVTAAAPVDQFQTSPTGGTIGFCEASVGETFIANVTGSLRRIEVAINRSPIGDPGDLTFHVRTVDSHGLPAAKILASATAAKADIALGATTAWLSLTVSPPAPMVAGEWYAMTTDAPDCVQPGDSGFGWGIAADDAYLRGTGLYASTTAGPWSRLESDIAFATFVQPSTPVLQPDLDVTPQGSHAWVGSGNYDRSGYTERIETLVGAGEARTWLVRIQNDGTRRDSFVVHGDATAKGFGIRYLTGRTGGHDATAPVIGTGLRIGPLGPGDGVLLRIVVKLGAKLASGMARKVFLGAASVAKPRHQDGIRLYLAVE